MDLDRRRGAARPRHPRPDRRDGRAVERATRGPARRDHGRRCGPGGAPARPGAAEGGPHRSRRAAARARRRGRVRQARRPVAARRAPPPVRRRHERPRTWGACSTARPRRSSPPIRPTACRSTRPGATACTTARASACAAGTSSRAPRSRTCCGMAQLASPTPPTPHGPPVAPTGAPRATATPRSAATSARTGARRSPSCPPSRSATSGTRAPTPSRCCRGSSAIGFELVAADHLGQGPLLDRPLLVPLGPRALLRGAQAGRAQPLHRRARPGHDLARPLAQADRLGQYGREAGPPDPEARAPLRDPDPQPPAAGRGRVRALQRLGHDAHRGRDPGPALLRDGDRPEVRPGRHRALAGVHGPDGGARRG